MNSLQDLFGLSFNSKLNSIQSSFQTAHDKAVTLISKMNDKISEKELGTDASWSDAENLPEHNYKSSPWGNSTIEVTNNDVSIDKDTLLQLIKNSEKLIALEANGVDNWEGYYEAMKELNVDYQKDAITDDVLIKQYCK